MIFGRTVNWSGVWRFVLLAAVFFVAFLALRFATMVWTGRAEIEGTDLLGAAMFAIFFARLVGRSTSARGRRLIVGAVLLGPPLVVLMTVAVTAAWEACLRLIQG
jgi:hypothetical protein